MMSEADQTRSPDLLQIVGSDAKNARFLPKRKMEVKSWGTRPMGVKRIVERDDIEAGFDSEI
jgi:hypothetical protein